MNWDAVLAVLDLYVPVLLLLYEDCIDDGELPFYLMHAGLISDLPHGTARRKRRVDTPAWNGTFEIFAICTMSEIGSRIL